MAARPCRAAASTVTQPIIVPPGPSNRDFPTDAGRAPAGLRRMTDGVTRDFAAALIAQLPALRRYAVALCGNAALGDDLVQDGIERALTRAATLQHQERLGGWLRSIVHNLYLDELRRRRVRGVKVDLDEMENHLAFSVAPAADSALGDTGLGEIARAMAALSVDHRQILVLAGVEELSYREIAAELAVPLGTVMSRLARARTALRAAMDAPGLKQAGAADTRA